MKKVIKLLTDHWGLLTIYLIEFVIFYQWFLPGYFFNGDTSFLKLFSLQNTTFLSIWKGYADLGGPVIDGPFILLNELIRLISTIAQVEFNNVGIKILFFYPYIFFTPLGMYMLCLYLTKSKIGSTVAALIYTLNSSILAAFAMGHLNLIMPYVFFPFIILSVFRYANSGKVSDWLGVTILMMLSSIYELRMTYLNFIWISIVILYLQIINRDLRKYLLLWSSIVVSVLMINLFWILPFIFMTNSSAGLSILSRDLFGATYLSLGHALSLTHPFWGSEGLKIFTKQPIIVFSIIYPIISILGILTNRKNNIIIPFAILFIIGVFLTKQTNEPFNAIYKLLYMYLPGFNAFRESTKFLQISIFATSVLAAFYLKTLSTYKKPLTFLITVIILLSIITQTKSIIGAHENTIFTRQDTSDTNYANLNSFLMKENQNTYFRTLWIPVGPNMSIIKDSMPHLLFASVTNKIQQLDTSPDSHVEDNSVFLKHSLLDPLLDYYSTKYIILPNTDSTLSENVYYWYEPKSHYAKVLDSLDFVKKVAIPNSNIEIYENTNYIDHLSYSSDFPSIKNTSKFIPAKHIQVSPSQYDLILPTDSQQNFIHFSEAYNQDWKMRVGEFNWFRSLFYKNYYYPEELHYETDTGLNVWEIDRQWLKSQNFSEKNIPITIYYAPEAWFNIGVIISLSFFLLQIPILLYLICRRYVSNQKK